MSTYSKTWSQNEHVNVIIQPTLTIVYPLSLAARKYLLDYYVDSRRSWFHWNLLLLHLLHTTPKSIPTTPPHISKKVSIIYPSGYTNRRQIKIWPHTGILFITKRIIWCVLYLLYQFLRRILVGRELDTILISMQTTDDDGKKIAEVSSKPRIHWRPPDLIYLIGRSREVFRSP